MYWLTYVSFREYGWPTYCCYLLANIWSSTIATNQSFSAQLWIWIEVENGMWCVIHIFCHIINWSLGYWQRMHLTDHHPEKVQLWYVGSKCDLSTRTLESSIIEIGLSSPCDCITYSTSRTNWLISTWPIVGSYLANVHTHICNDYAWNTFQDLVLICM